MTFRAIALAFGLSFSAFAAAQQAAAPIPLEQFLKRDVFGTIRISPTGEYLAATVPLEDRTSLVILRRSDLKPTGHVTLPAKTHIVDFNWVNPTRVLFTIGEKQGELNKPSATGEIYGVNADGTGQGMALIGSRAAGRRGQSNAVFADILDTLKSDDDNVLISVYGGAYGEVERMNVNDGRRVTLVKAPVKRASFLTDPSGEVRFAWGAGDDNRTKTYYRADGKSAWQLINDEASTDKIVTPHGFSADGKYAYLESEEDSGPNGIYSFDVKTQQRVLVSRDDNTDPAGLLFSPVTRTPYAVTYQDGKPRVDYLDPEDPFAKSLRGLQASLPDQAVVPTSYSQDGALGVYVAYADNVAGDFYLLDRNTGKATYLASRNSWLKPETLGTMRPVTITARDGLKIEGFLTLPAGSAGKNLPLVVNPHGGPFGPFDIWAFNPDVQILASRGYAVLQVNFRGSGNYGRSFMHAGYKQWGGKMQDDVTDATHWAISEGIANPRRICLYGASYGGYATLMGVAKEPDLYRCGFGNVGVYDMPAMYHTGDIADSKTGENFLDEVLGHDNLEQISPDHLADRIKVPVYMTAGKEDVRAPMKHSEMMRDALQKLGKPVEVKFYDGEGHGNYLIANQIDFYNRLLGFLDKHIGPGSQVATASK